jgi:hypothetical protein
VTESQKKLSSPSEAAQLKTAIDQIHGRYKTLREKAMDDYVDQSDRIMGLPKMIEGPIPPEKTTTRPSTTKPAKAPPVTPQK